MRGIVAVCVRVEGLQMARTEVMVPLALIRPANLKLSCIGWRLTDVD